MEPDPIGLLIVLVASAIACFGEGAAIRTAVALQVFPATALASLSALGGASVTVPQFGLVLLFVLAMTRRRPLLRVAAALAREPACQTLALFAVYAVASALLFPRLFAGSTEVFTLARVAEVIVTVPLAPSSGNITQTFYILGDIIAFFCVVTLARDARSAAAFAAGLKALVGLQVGAALLDAAGKYAGAGAIIGFVHTASYTTLTEVDVGGIPRLTGTYAEASSFAVFSAGQIALAFAMWRGGADGRAWPALACLLIVLVALSTSSVGYVFLGLAGMWFSLLAAAEFFRGRVQRSTLLVLATVPVGVLALLALVLMDDAVLRGLSDFFDQMLFNKGTSESGRERSSWNAQALLNLRETAGFGIGLGSARSSSWLLSLLSQLGLFGGALYLLFVALALATPSAGAEAGGGMVQVRAFQRGCKALILATMLAASFSWTLADLGLTFHIAAALTVCLGRLPSGAGVVQGSGV